MKITDLTEETKECKALVPLAPMRVGEVRIEPLRASMVLWDGPRAYIYEQHPITGITRRKYLGGDPDDHLGCVCD